MNRSAWHRIREAWIVNDILERTSNDRPGSSDGVVRPPVAGASGAVLRRLGIVPVAAGTVLLAACSVGASPRKMPIHVLPTPAPPETIRGGVCIDGTGSMNSSVIERGIEAVAQAVEGWVPIVVNDAAGSAPMPALDLVVRKVMGESSLSMDGQVTHVQIPGVPGAMGKPKVGEPGFAQLSIARIDQNNAVSRMADQAARYAADEAGKIRGADWSSGGSEISGCIEALALVVPGPGIRRFILVSDLNQTAPEQVGMARFDGVRLLVVHDCIVASQCIEQSNAWSAALRSRGADTVEFSRPENAVHDIAAWLHTGALQ